MELISPQPTKMYMTKNKENKIPDVIWNFWQIWD